MTFCMGADGERVICLGFVFGLTVYYSLTTKTRRMTLIEIMPTIKIMLIIFLLF